MFEKFKNIFVGGDKNPLDNRIFHQVTLIAFLAWIGLGADGLSSSAYGPEEAFRALGMDFRYLAFYLAIATALTVFIISASYNHIIELFPSGGGGYVVASKLLGQGAGLVSGCALLVDYILTISISTASGADAIFSFLPPEWQSHKLIFEMGVLLVLIWLNMRGIKESIVILMPIFILFMITHVVMIAYGVLSHGSQIPTIVQETLGETRRMVDGPAGWTGFLAVLLTAYSLGGGTYTGIEAVANGIPNLREPKVKTGKRTMLYMATSLAFTAGGILLCYMLWDFKPTAGKTFNALVSEQIFASWNFGGWEVGKWMVFLILLSEGLLLFVAAQTGFLDGPNVLSNMAMDSWAPHRFANLSNRLVRLNGVFLMGGMALLVLWLTKGHVSVLVVLYAINVFLTFSLSQLSMCIHWWQDRRQNKAWWRSFAINGLGLVLTSFVLVVTTVIKFSHGGWVTLLLTGSFIAVCLAVRRHYDSIRKALKRLDEMLVDLPFPEAPPQNVPPQPEGPTAVLMVEGYNGLGIHSIFSIRKLFRGHEFKNLVFISVGLIDSSRFKGVKEIENLRQATEEGLGRYVDLAKRMGYASEYRMALGTDVTTEIVKLCERISTDYVEPVFFAGKLIFAEENLFTRFLHNQTSLELQRRLLFEGYNMVVMPIRVL